MRKLLGTTILIIGITVGYCANAADLTPVYKAPPAPPAPPQATNWSGFYFGGNFGADIGGHDSWSSNDPFYFSGLEESLGGASMRGVLGGLQAGYNWQTGPLVLGVETAWSLTDIHGQTASEFEAFGDVDCVVGAADGETCTLNASSRLTWIGTAVGRVGVAIGQALLYVGGGAAWTHVKNNLVVSVDPPSFSGSDTPFGGTFLTGTDYAIDQHWSVRVQYNYYDFGSQTASLDAPGPPISVKTSLIVQSLIGGVNYRF